MRQIREEEYKRRRDALETKHLQERAAVEEAFRYGAWRREGQGR